MLNFNKELFSYRYLKNSPVGILILRLLLIMLLFTICRVIFYAFNHSLFPGIDSAQLFTIFSAGLRFDLTAVLYFNLLYILLVLLPHKQHHKKGFIRSTNIIFYVTNSLAIFLNCIDFIYYRFTNRRTSMMVFDEFAGETNFLQLLYHFAVDYYYVGLIFIVFVAITVVLTKKQKFLAPILSGWKYFAFNTILMIIFLGITVIGVRGGLPPKQDFPLNPSDAGQYVEHPNDIAIVLNTPFTMLLSMDKPAYPVKQYFKSEEELSKVYNPIHVPDSMAITRPINIVIIMVESLGCEPIGFYNQNLDNGKYKGYTPFLDSLCHHSYVFINSYANSRISIEGSPAVAASIPSLQESYTVSLYSGNKIMSLASCLNKMGYSTYYFHGAPNGSLGLNSFAKVAEFQNYIGKTEYNNDSDFDGVWGIWDHLFLPFVVNYHNNIKSPFFSFIFTASSHHPYKIPSHLKDKLPDGKLEIHKSMAYADYSLREFFKSASKQEWYNNTLFVITGDHTCSTYYPEYKTTAGAFSVPIIFYQPGTKMVGIDSTFAQQIDIMPTILNYVGYNKEYFAFGQDLFKNDTTKFGVNYIGNSFQLINKEWVLQFDLDKTIALYNLKSDVLLQNNLINKNLTIQKYLENQIKAFIQQYNGRMVNNKLTLD
jgi:phosphoglycerol transferase MdoB-like AlkP superfamily enzyme